MSACLSAVIGSEMPYCSEVERRCKVGPHLSATALLS